MGQRGEETPDGSPGSGQPSRRQLLAPSFQSARELEQENRDRSPRRASEPRDRSPRQSGENRARPGDVDMVSDRSLQDMVNKELGRYLPPEVVKTMKKHCSELVNKIRGLQKTNDRISTVRQELEVLGKGQLPKGMRPVPHTFETYLLDEAACQNGISMSIQAGDSIRGAKERFHLANAKVQRELDLQLLELHRSKLKMFVRQNAFVERCLVGFYEDSIFKHVVVGHFGY